MRILRQSAVCVVGAATLALAIPLLKLRALQIAGSPAGQAPDSQAANPSAVRLSRSAQQELAQARQLLQAGQNDQAITHLREVLRKEPDNGEAHRLLGSALALVPERSEALHELARAVELQPSSALTRFALGAAQARFGEAVAARQSFEKALVLDPKFPEAHVSLAMVLGQQKQLASAKEHLNQAIHLYGNKSPAAQPHYLLARILIEQNEPQKALDELERAIALRPDYAEAYVAQGLIHKWQHRDTAAIAAFKKAVALDPDDYDGQFELGSAYMRMADPGQAIGPLREAVKLKPDDRTTWYQLCIALQKAGKQEESKACQQELAAKISSGLAAAANELTSTQANNAGLELERAGDLSGALEKYREAVRLDPEVKVFRRNMALALCRLGRWQEGIIELREVLKQDPDDAQATKALYIALENAHLANAGASTNPGPSKSK